MTPEAIAILRTAEPRLVWGEGQGWGRGCRACAGAGYPIPNDMCGIWSRRRGVWWLGRGSGWGIHGTVSWTASGEALLFSRGSSLSSDVPDEADSNVVTIHCEAGSIMRHKEAVKFLHTRTRGQW